MSFEEIGENVPIETNGDTDSLHENVALNHHTTSLEKNRIPSYLELTDFKNRIKNAEILRGINIAIPPGRLVALMGPSGAGKTTLLNLLAGRGVGVLEGEILHNGKPVTRRNMRSACKVVPQHDILTPILTAKETLQYTAEFVVGDKSNRENRVRSVIEMLSLESCENVICGGPDKKGLSGGQLKRVSIGMELLEDPSILLLDEPTSGLDSKVSEDVVDTIKYLTSEGRTVVCTIHQPSFQIFSKFDWLVLLSTGFVVYNGPVDELSNYLIEIGHPCPKFINPVDYFLQVISRGDLNELTAVEIDDMKATSSEMPDIANEDSENENKLASKAREWSNVFSSSSIGEAARKDKEEIRIARENMSTKTASSPQGSYKLGNGFKTFVTNVSKHGDYSTSIPSQMLTISRRALYVTIKDRGQMIVRVIQLIIMGLIISTIFLRISNTQSRGRDRMSVLFLIMLYLSMSSIMHTAMTLPVEKGVFLREVNNGYYSLVAYYPARVSVLLLFQICYSLLLGVVVYYIIGLNPAADRFFIFLAALILIALIAGILGFIAGVQFPTPQQVSAVVPMIVMPLAIFSGLFIPEGNIPGYWIWMYYLSFFQYTLQILVVNEFDGRTFEPCFISKGESCPYCSGSVQPCSTDSIMKAFDFNPDNSGRSFGILVGFFVAFLGLGAFVLYRFVNKRR